MKKPFTVVIEEGTLKQIKMDAIKLDTELYNYAAAAFKFFLDAPEIVRKAALENQ